MPNQLTQDPNKALAKTNGVGIKDIAEPISYFVTGCYLIWTILSSKSAVGTIEAMVWFTSIVGGVLIIAGLVSLIIIPFSKRLANVISPDTDSAFTLQISVLNIIN